LGHSQGNKRKTRAEKGGWSNEVSRVLMFYDNTPQSTTRETSFNLVVGTYVFDTCGDSGADLQSY